MPRISEFYFIAIYLYYLDHSPPHFHVRYAGQKATVDMETGEFVNSNLPVQARRLVSVWHEAHRSELFDRWEQARLGRNLFPIKPLV